MDIVIVNIIIIIVVFNVIMIITLVIKVGSSTSFSLANW
jgi:hypothetical protein